MSKFRFAVGTLLLYTASSQAQTLRKECTRDRCVYYSRNERIVVAEREGPDRVRLQFPSGKRLVLTEDRSGSIRVEKNRRRW